MNYIAITGRQSELSVVELESLLGAESLKVTSKQAVIIDQNIDINDLGGTQKIYSLNDLNYQLPQLVDFLTNHIKQQNIASKLIIGFSDYTSKRHQTNNLLFDIKKSLNKQSINCRVITGNKPQLTTAQTVNNKLNKNNGVEFCLINHNNQLKVGVLNQVQNLKAYTGRDQNRPFRDDKVGMLPPKLAQIIINLSAGANSYKNRANLNLLDPFCGSGVVLQEALLQGYSVQGSDLSKKMVEYSQANLDWLQKYNQQTYNYKVDIGDATKTSWHNTDLIACETYLGLALTNNITVEEVNRQQSAVNKTVSGFLKNLSSQVNPGFRLAIAVANWQLNNKQYTLPIIDNLAEIGYTLTEFSHVNTSQLVYRRPGQIVGRQLLVLAKE